MASQPKRRRVDVTLAARARRDIGPAAGPLDYVVAWIAHGGSVARLAGSLQSEMRESVSRPFCAFVAHRLAQDATERIERARAARGTVIANAVPVPQALTDMRVASMAGRRLAHESWTPAAHLVARLSPTAGAPHADAATEQTRQ